MSTNQKITIFNFIKWFKSYYISLEKDTLPFPCKLAGFAQKNGSTCIKVEFSGQLNYIEVEIQKIINENLFEYFSPKDKKEIFQAFYKNEERFKLSDSYYCKEKKLEMVVLTEISTGNKVTLPASIVSKDENLSHQISKNDLKRISYKSGMEFMKNIFNKVKK